ncbi:MAG: sensor domain-containing diguanylate cyclase [Thiovulaceae bacterium]|nr:sensor domain-containing diguanylate cyclase [Sulfurimonadaceae bacterium]MCW9026896.1 sensor domain-containing diguanylate cyclase [Sulfurimonadaceae bacterium]
MNAHIDTYFFYAGFGSFLDFLIFNVPISEAYARTLVLTLCITFGYIFSKSYFEHIEYKLLLEYSIGKSSEAIFWLNRDGSFHYVNKSAAKNLGYEIEEFMKLNIFDLKSNNFTKEKWLKKWYLLKEKRTAQFETRYLNKENIYVDVEVLANYVMYKKKEYFVAFVRDIAKRKEKEEKITTLNKELEVLANTDSLTGISNRYKFDESLKEYLANNKKQSDAKTSLLIYDIDHFKKINDSFGHKIGDIVLVELVEVTKQHIRQSDIFARWGGEEFVILLPNTNLDNALYVAKKIHKAIKNHEFETVKKISISIGVAVASECDTTETLFTKADEALYKAKEDGRDRIVF